MINEHRYITDNHCYVYSQNAINSRLVLKLTILLPNVEVPIRHTFTSETIKTLPYTDIADMIAYLPPV